MRQIIRNQARLRRAARYRRSAKPIKAHKYVIPLSDCRTCIFNVGIGLRPFARVLVEHSTVDNVIARTCKRIMNEVGCAVGHCNVHLVLQICRRRVDILRFIAIRQMLCGKQGVPERLIVLVRIIARNIKVLQPIRSKTNRRLVTRNRIKDVFLRLIIHHIMVERNDGQIAGFNSAFYVCIIIAAHIAAVYGKKVDVKLFTVCAKRRSIPLCLQGL